MAPRTKFRKAASHLQTEPRVTRNQSKADPSLAPKPEEQPTKPTPTKKKRVYAQPWVNFVAKSGRNVVAARRKAGVIVKKASEQQREEWRKKAQPPKEQSESSSAPTIDMRFVTQRRKQK